MAASSQRAGAETSKTRDALPCFFLAAVRYDSELIELVQFGAHAAKFGADVVRARQLSLNSLVLLLSALTKVRNLGEGIDADAAGPPSGLGGAAHGARRISPQCINAQPS